MKPENLSKQYTGRAAAGYDRNRAANPLWQAETAVIEGFLATVPPGGPVLDIPVGTGRFLELYARFGLRATGIDVSPDMLAQAAKKARALKLDVTLEPGDIRRIGAPDGSFEAALCIRLAHLIETPILRAAVGELARVARTYVVIGVPHYVPIAELARGLPYGIVRFANQWVRRGKERARDTPAGHRRLPMSTVRSWTSSAPPVSSFNHRLA